MSEYLAGLASRLLSNVLLLLSDTLSVGFCDEAFMTGVTRLVSALRGPVLTVSGGGAGEMEEEKGPAATTAASTSGPDLLALPNVARHAVKTLYSCVEVRGHTGRVSDLVADHLPTLYHHTPVGTSHLVALVLAQTCSRPGPRAVQWVRALISSLVVEGAGDALPPAAGSPAVAPVSVAGGSSREAVLSAQAVLRCKGGNPSAPLTAATFGSAGLPPLALAVLTVFNQSPASTYAALFSALSHIVAESAAASFKCKSEEQALEAAAAAGCSSGSAKADEGLDRIVRARANSSSTLWAAMQTLSVLWSTAIPTGGADGNRKSMTTALATLQPPLRAIQKFRQQCLQAEAAGAEDG